MRLDIAAQNGDDLGPTDHNRALIAEVRALAGACTDEVPFLLVPVRIETRFVQTEEAVTGQGGTAELTVQLAAAALAVEALVRRPYATLLPNASARVRREYKASVELPLVQAAAADIKALSDAAGKARAALRDVGEASAAWVTALHDVTTRVTKSLAGVDAALAQVRSPYHRGNLMTALTPVRATVKDLIAEAESVVGPAAALIAALRAPTADGTPKRVTFGAGESGAVAVTRARLAETAKAHARLNRELSTLEELADTLDSQADIDADSREPVARERAVADAALDQTLERALVESTTIALLPQDWQRELSSRVADIATRLERTLGGEAAPQLKQIRQLTSSVDALLTDQLDRVDPARPAVTVPLRQTRVVDQLRVRVFPDDFSVYSHESKLTAAERNAGLAFWTESAAPADEAGRRAAWRALCAGFGSPRAAWIARRTRPPLVAPTDADLKDAAWTQPPRAALLPRRFVVVTVSGDRVSHVVAGAPVPADLTLGLDPRAANAATEAAHIDAAGKLVVGASLSWMVEYDTAAAAGMAITIPITPDEARDGFDRVYVLGLADQTDPDRAQRDLADLLDNHHYKPGGLALVATGTPTNNSDGAAAGYRRGDDPDRSFVVEQGNELVTSKTTPSDGSRLARGLGVAAATFDHVAAADGDDIGEAITANAALWPATAGYAVEELLGSVIGLDSRDRLRAFAVDHVLGRGVLPTLRVGFQPYGVLATTAFTRFAPDGGDTLPVGPVAALPTAEAQRRFEILLRDVLLTVYTDWAAVAATVVPHAYTVGISDAQNHVLSVLGLDAVGAGYAQRFALNAGRRGTGIGPFPTATGLPPDAATTVVREGPFAVLQRFASVFAAAGGIGAGPLVDEGLVTTPYADIFDRLEGSRGFEVSYLDATVPLGGTVGADDLAARTDALLNATLEELARNSSTVESAQPLLFLLLRQALLVAARDAALRILDIEGLVAADVRARVGAGDMFSIARLGASRRQNVTRWSYLLARLSGLSGAFGRRAFSNAPGTLYGFLTAGPAERRMDDYLIWRGDNPLANAFTGPLAAAHRGVMAPLRTHADAVRRLGHLPRDRAERVTLEHLDICSHRLDAWLLGLGAARLDRLRTSRPTGVHLGAFGWVEDLRPSPVRTPAAGVPPVLDTDPRAPVYAGGAGGFIHAPSLNHAATAAILHAGYLAHGPQPGVENRMAVNLSSRRTRAALNLLDGIGAGNDLGALLGAQFERDLHDAADQAPIVLDDLIAPLRRRFPSFMGLDDSAQIADADRRHVVDGLRLLTTVRERLGGGVPGSTVLAALRANGHALYPYGLVDAAGASLLPAIADSARLEPVLRALDRLADSVDAVADLVVVEGMHQIVQGNHPRAAAVLSALGEGRAPARPEVVDTPTVGTLVSHRVLLHLAPTGLPDGWTASSARAAVEPALNRWLGELIGPPGQTRAQVVDADGGPVADVSLAALEVQPIDLLAILRNGLSDGLDELAARVLDTLRPIDVRENEPAPARQLSLERHPDWPDEIRGLAETAAVIESVSAMLGRARAATSADYVVADTVTSVGAGADAVELADRVDVAENGLAALGVRLLGLISDGGDADATLLSGNLAGYVADHAPTYRAGGAGGHLGRLDALWARRQDFRSALMDALGFGIGVTLPTRWESRDQVGTAWLVAAEIALIEVGRRLVAARAVTGSNVDAALTRGRAIFTDALPLLARFRPSNPTELATAVANPPTVEPGIAVSRWLAGVATVRENVAALTTATTLADAFGCPVPTAVPVQLPAKAGEAWLGEAAPADAGSRLSLVLLAPQHLRTNGDDCVALRVDGWDELIPAAEVTTGVAFSYDQPDATPPQCLLLAVAPRLRGHWVWEDLVQTLHDTLELAKIRAIEPEHVQNDLYGQLLPALIGDIRPYSERGSGGGTGLSDHRVVLDFGAVQPGTGEE